MQIYFVYIYFTMCIYILYIISSAGVNFPSGKTHTWLLMYVS